MFLGKEPSCSVSDHPDVASEGLHRVLSWVALLGLPRSLLGAWISGFWVGLHFPEAVWPRKRSGVTSGRQKMLHF